MLKRKLWEVTPGTYIRAGGEVFYFHHLDGMYSLCSDKNGDALHLAAFSDVEIVEDPKWKDSQI